MGVGLGFGFDISKNCRSNARYVAGFSDITKPASGPSTDAKNKNNAFQVGFNFKVLIKENLLTLKYLNWLLVF